MTFAGASSVPANMPPIMTVDAPGGDGLGDVAREADTAVGDQGTPGALSALARTIATALICGTPTPATMRVVQMSPGRCRP